MDLNETNIIKTIESWISKGGYKCIIKLQDFDEYDEIFVNTMNNIIKETYHELLFYKLFQIYLDYSQLHLINCDYLNYEHIDVKLFLKANECIDFHLNILTIYNKYVMKISFY